MKEKKKKELNWTNIILFIIFFIGLAIVLYPTISNYWNRRTQTKAIMNYDAAISQMSEEDFSEYFAAAEEYNNKLSSLDFPLNEAEKIDGYESILDVLGNGMIGYISIDKIKVKLPIYHGTSNAVLDVATGHLKGSSMPIGGESTHSLLSSHRGLPSAKLFTDLDKLNEGDTFTITVLNRVVTYEVDQIRIIEPNNLQDLQIEEGMDYCTLITCTPYGINTHRLLVRGHRVENSNNITTNVVSDAMKIEAIFVAPVIAIPIILIMLIFVLIRYRRKK